MSKHPLHQCMSALNGTMHSLLCDNHKKNIALCPYFKRMRGLCCSGTLTAKSHVSPRPGAMNKGPQLPAKKVSVKTFFYKLGLNSNSL